MAGVAGDLTDHKISRITGEKVNLTDERCCHEKKCEHGVIPLKSASLTSTASIRALCELLFFTQMHEVCISYKNFELIYETRFSLEASEFMRANVPFHTVIRDAAPARKSKTARR